MSNFTREGDENRHGGSGSHSRYERGQGRGGHYRGGRSGRQGGKGKGKGAGRGTETGGRRDTCYGCDWCTGAGSKDREVRNRCPEFRRLKKATSPAQYLDMELLLEDEKGFAAAGVLLFRRSGGGGGDAALSEGKAGVDLLLAREYREGDVRCPDRGGDKLNWLGGKRVSKLETAQTCAITNLNGETGGCLLPSTLASMRQDGFPLVLWSPRSKYVLFMFELTEEEDREVDVASLSAPGAEQLEWVSRQELENTSFQYDELHLFTEEMLQDIIACNVLDSLEALFDVARSDEDCANVKVSTSCTTTSEEDSELSGDGLAEMLAKVRISSSAEK